MFRISKKVNILLFILVTILFLMSKFFAIETLAMGGGTSATTNISYVEGTQTTSLPGKPESYYLNVTVSSDTYTEPYSIIYLKRSEFNQPRPADVSGSPTIKNVAVTWDATYWKIKVTYNVLAPGPMVSNPFRATMTSRKFANGETATIETRLFTKDGVELANNTKQVTAETYVMGVNSPDDGTIRGWSRGGANTNVIISDDETDANHSHIKNGFTDTWYTYAQNGTKHVNDTEITASNYGADRRKTRTILTLPSSIIWDPSLPDNADWTYDPVAHTITKDIDMPPGAISYFTNFTAKHDGTQSVNASGYSTIYIPQTNYLINDDGSVDMSTERKSRVYKSYRYAQKIYLFKWNILPETDGNGQNNAGDRYVHLGANDGKDKWMINVSQYWGATPVTGSTVKFKSILDTPNDRVDFTGYGFRVWESMFDAANLAKLNQNKLIGINDDGSEEVIATNINYTPVTNNVDYFKWDTDHSMTAKHYKAVRLDFNDEITISGYAENAVGLFLETKLTPQAVTTIENRLAAGQNYTAYNIGRVLSNTGDSMREAIIRRHYQRDFAKIRMDKHSQNINGNSSLTNVQLGDNINYHVYAVYDSFVGADRTVQNAKVIFLVDPELEFDSALHHNYQAQYRFTLNTTPQRVDNYKGTGKTAYVFDLDNFTLPKRTSTFSGVDRLYFNFKPTTSLEEGEHTVEAFMTWDNNSTDASGYAPNTVYSSSTVDFLDKYDANNNGSTTDRLSYQSFKFNFIPPRAVILTKKQKLTTETNYNSAINAESGDIVEYKLSAWNNSIDNARELNVMDIFPYENDKEIVKDEHGNYVARGSKMYPILQGPVTAPAGYTVYYSTDAPSGTIEANAAANWVQAGAITDWSSVTMFKAVMNNSYQLVPGSTDVFTYRVKIPETKELEAGSSANNSVASWYGNNLNGASESLISKVTINKYIIAGKAYYDVDENGSFNTGDIVAANRPVRLVKVDGGVETVIDTILTDNDGNYTFKDKISTEGDYKVYIETLAGDIIRPLNASTATMIGNDFTNTVSLPSKMKENQVPVPNVNWVELDVPLRRTNTNKIKNLGLKSVYTNLVVKHIKRDDNTELSPTVTTRQPNGTPYTTAPVTDNFYEAETPLPTNANGEYGLTDTTVTYYYVRKAAGDVTVHHYEENSTTELATTVVQPGANKLGLAYTTNEETINNYELVAQPANKNGTFTAAAQTVDYYYRRKNAGNITVKYLESGTNTQLHADKILDGTKKLGLTYSESAETIANFDLDTTNLPTNDNGVYTTAPITITYYYKRQDAGNVVAKYLEDTTNTVLATEETQNGAGKLGLPYTTVAKTVANYELTANPANATGTFTTTEQTVTYVYRRKNAANVIVKHLEQGTNAVLYPNELLDGTGKLGLPYTTQARTTAQLPNYELVAGVPASVTGSYIEQATPVEIIYLYKRQDAGDVTATYVDDITGDVLHAPEVQSGTNKLGLAYDTDQKSFANYDLIAVPTNKSGTFTTTPVLVEYKYKRGDAANVRVKHINAITGASLAPDEVLSGTGRLGLTYTTAAKTVADLPNYELVGGMPANATGTYQTGAEIVVTYRYQRENAGNVIATYTDEADGSALHAPVGQSGDGMLGLPYDTEVKTFADYDLVALPTNKAGTFSNTNVTVSYVYRRRDAGDVTVNHIEVGTGDVLYASTILNGTRKLGLPYSTNSENINLYDLITVPANATGVFSVGAQTVNYEYARKNAGDVTVHHISKYDGSDLIANEVLDGSRKLGLAYSTSMATIPDYEIFSLPANANGVYTTSSQNVTYVYKRKDGGEVKAVYVDEAGVELANAENISGVENAGLPYTTTAKAIAHYELISMPANASGVITSSPQTVTYTYRRKNGGNIKVFYVDEESGEDLVSPKVIEGAGKLGLNYTTDVETIENLDLISMPANASGVFTEDEQTVVYVYRRKNAGNVTIHYVDPAGRSLSADDVLNGSRKLGLPYSTSAIEINGYHFLRSEGNTDGIFRVDDQEVTYVYLKDPSVIIIPNPLIPATPSNVTIPGDRNNDYIIRPNRATPSTATRSNAGRGGSGSSGGSSNANIRAERVVQLIDSGIKKENPEAKPIETPNAQPATVDRQVVAKGSAVGREKLPVPKTEDRNNIYIYLLMLTLSLTAFARVKNKED
ncbi:hypothetical protein LSA36186_22490 [Lachnoanaerobaculum sp. JCM 36186]|uniref:MucBP domain-containing protein n=1 Tax=Lachnoanaerobaculum sanguinis TaxID=3065809 RepID=UPI00277A7311|nr:MucBP domain-containing protein [Lachnoanaerobaculum sp. JCM 36186]GMO03999.1 hypothetical protein LSA36186_22490 [Lachnoanaerobaculum sp. JCM 36186]